MVRLTAKASNSGFGRSIACADFYRVINNKGFNAVIQRTILIGFMCSLHMKTTPVDVLSSRKAWLTYLQASAKLCKWSREKNHVLIAWIFLKPKKVIEKNTWYFC